MAPFKKIVVGLFVALLLGNMEIGYADTPLTSHIVNGVPVIKQSPELPTGCEATSLTMLLQWAKVNVKKTDVAAAFPKVPVPETVNGKLVGGNPNAGFVGDPFSDDGYGVYHGPVAGVLNHFLPNRALDLSAKSFDQVIAAVASDRPVVVWIADDMQAPHLDVTWYDQQGQAINWMVPEHVVLLTGFTPTAVTVNDPERGGVITYPRQLFQQRWEQMGSQAVTVTQAPAAGATLTKTPSATSMKGAHPNVAKSTSPTAWLQAVRSFFKINKNSMAISFAKIFGVILGVYLLNLLVFSRIIKRRKRSGA